MSALTYRFSDLSFNRGFVSETSVDNCKDISMSEEAFSFYSDPVNFGGILFTYVAQLNLNSSSLDSDRFKNTPKHILESKR